MRLILTKCTCSLVYVHVYVIAVENIRQRTHEALFIWSEIDMSA